MPGWYWRNQERFRNRRVDRTKLNFLNQKTSAVTKIIS